MIYKCLDINSSEDVLQVSLSTEQPMLIPPTHPGKVAQQFFKLWLSVSSLLWWWKWILHLWQGMSSSPWNLLCSLHQVFYQQVCLVLFRTCIIRKEFSWCWKEWPSITHQVRKLEALEQKRNEWNIQLKRKNVFSSHSCCENNYSYLSCSLLSPLRRGNHSLPQEGHVLL